MTTTPVFCPNCGADRAADARFCASCGRSFEPAPTPMAEAKRSRGVGGIVALLVFLGVIAAFVWIVGGDKLLGTKTLSNGADVPPVGQVWFGTTFDSSTLELSGRTSSVGSTSPFSLVGHLTKSMAGKDLVVRIYFNGALVGTTGINAAGDGDVWGMSPGPLFAAGEWRYDFTDVGGNVLATGTVTAT